MRVGRVEEREWTQTLSSAALISSSNKDGHVRKGNSSLQRPRVLAVKAHVMTKHWRKRGQRQHQGGSDHRNSGTKVDLEQSRDNGIAGKQMNLRNRKEIESKNLSSG